MADEATNNQDVSFSQEDIDQINRDIEETKKALVGDKPKEEPKTDTQSLKDEIKAQILAEMRAEEEKKRAEAAKVSQEQEVLRQKQEAEKRLADLQAQVDKLTESKAVVNVKSPFTGDEKDLDALINDREKMQAVDNASREEFFKQRG